ncbi:TPA: hypothetical protein I0I28_RS09320 [Enterococcus faecium]|uniref:hypothetical protein n=1 Tax=Enterococcus faecium TaxID=1352 RepID=UPI0005EB52BE|nr:hypothetical protein [Enterococcus faecium]KNB95790.1 hypothetical protein LK34_01395 [Enterococcus faecium]
MEKQKNELFNVLSELKFYEWQKIKEIVDRSFQDNLTSQKIENKEVFKKRLQDSFTEGREKELSSILRGNRHESLDKRVRAANELSALIE